MKLEKLIKRNIEAVTSFKIETDIIKISSNKIYAGEHWRKRKKLKDNYLFLTNSFKTLPKLDFKVNLYFSFYFKKNALDSSNCFYMAKILEDCLVHHQVLQDDTVKYVGQVSCESKKGNKDYCVITIDRYKQNI